MGRPLWRLLGTEPLEGIGPDRAARQALGYRHALTGARKGAGVSILRTGVELVLKNGKNLHRRRECWPISFKHQSPRKSFYLWSFDRTVFFTKGLSKLDNLDEEWATEHANQVSRMLPGGLLVLGVFIITTLELANDFQNALRRLIFAMEKSMNRKRLWNFTEEEISERVILHICSSTKKISCRTYDVHDPKSSARPADWKYQSGLSTSWLSLDCTIHIDIHIPLSSTSVSYTLEKNTKNGLTRWAKQIENGVYLINGQVKDEDCDLLEGQKKSFRGNTQATSHSFDVRVLTQLLLNLEHRSTATVQICSGSVNLKGSVKCRAYIHSNKPKVKDAMQAVKRDILNTVADRCEILFEDLLLNEIPEKKVMSIK
ncbi:Hypothetical predicted protein [Marmota monax]|uniref:Protein odr-4 homolog n=1 Tax=Marmota monax TaxID=9995 RepID=A0A5E4CB27_MARMO|nr:hypothetical protein GHT09_019913 [Marmota monax]VTJ78925.1 Hypothetical predicted protein [Marmota monax]